MHDAKGRPLQKGDRVILVATVTEVWPHEDYCNVSIASEFGRRPDDNKETACINTGVLLRQNPGDDNADSLAPAGEAMPADPA